MIKLEIKFTIYSSTPDIPLIDCYWQFYTWQLAFLLASPHPNSLSIIHSSCNIYSHISISLGKDQSFFPYAAETYNIYHRLQKRRKENLRIFPSAVFLLWIWKHPSPAQFCSVVSLSQCSLWHNKADKVRYPLAKVKKNRPGYW